ncbi:prefoldin subunit 4-like [Daphnia pulicaria]|uniref:prefoldin subunit 4-like n=1 Tax=Daphnia pulicaria TaxID=35523 RepID=UPI001EEB188B|nr:prefoldin subunit 4-like [Daphnia pulicaria]
MASVAVSKDSLESDSDIHITLEDQQKINRFARHNAKWEELRDDLKNKKGDLQNLEDASDDLLLVDDESALIPFVVGEVFVHFNMEEAKEKLEEAKDKVKKDIEAIEAECTNIKTLMSDLKTQLYAKFGNSINLEAEEE